jgi:hypothetical protein
MALPEAHRNDALPSRDEGVATSNAALQALLAQCFDSFCAVCAAMTEADRRNRFESLSEALCVLRDELRGREL